MAMSYGQVFANGILGAIGGAGKGAAQVAENEMKEEMARAREDRLSKLRMGEYEAKATFDQKMKDTATARDRAEVGDFYKSTKAPGTGIINEASATFTTDEGSEESSVSNSTTAMREASRREQAEYRREEAKKTGNKTLIDQTYTEARDIRAEDEQERRTKADEKRNEVAAIRAEADRMRAEASQEQAAAATKRAEALLARIANPKGEGSEKDTARIRDVKFYAENVFGGREAKTEAEKQDALRQAALFVAGKEEKPDIDRAITIADQLKDDLDWSIKPYSERLAEAKRLISGSSSAPRRGGVQPRGRVTDAPAPSGNRPPLSSFDGKK